MENAHGYDFHHAKPVPPDIKQQDFVCLKASQGIAWRDPAFVDRAQEFFESGLIVIAYHWFETEAWADPKMQAENFSQAVSLASGVEVSALCADFERYNNPVTGREEKDLAAFMAQLEFLEPNKELGIYTNPGSWQERMYGNRFTRARRLAKFKKYFLWQAQWGADAPDPLEPWGSDWLFWQYGVLPVDGILFDHDFFNGTREMLHVRFGAPPDTPDIPVEPEATADQLIDEAIVKLNHAKELL